MLHLFTGQTKCLLSLHPCCWHNAKHRHHLLLYPLQRLKHLFQCLAQPVEQWCSLSQYQQKWGPAKHEVRSLRCTGNFTRWVVVFHLHDREPMFVNYLLFHFCVNVLWQIEKKWYSVKYSLDLMHNNISKYERMVNLLIYNYIL